MDVNIGKAWQVATKQFLAFHPEWPGGDHLFVLMAAMIEELGLTYQPSLRSLERAYLAVIRQAVADYMHSEGFGCCRDDVAHSAHAEMLGQLLNVPMYADGSGRNFHDFERK